MMLPMASAAVVVLVVAAGPCFALRPAPVPSAGEATSLPREPQRGVGAGGRTGTRADRRVGRRCRDNPRANWARLREMPKNPPIWGRRVRDGFRRQ